MDAFADAVAWYNCTFARTADGDYWRVWFDGCQPRIQRLGGTEPEWREPLTELKRREAAYGNHKVPA
jgi:hypothetical protein